MAKRNKSVEETPADFIVSPDDAHTAETFVPPESNGLSGRRIADPRSRSRYWLVVEDGTNGMIRVVEGFKSSKKASDQAAKMRSATFGLPLTYRVVRVKPINPTTWGQ